MFPSLNNMFDLVIFNIVDTLKKKILFWTKILNIESYLFTLIMCISYNLIVLSCGYYVCSWNPKFALCVEIMCKLKFSKTTNSKWFLCLYLLQSQSFLLERIVEKIDVVYKLNVMFIKKTFILNFIW